MNPAHKYICNTFMKLIANSFPIWFDVHSTVIHSILHPKVMTNNTWFINMISAVNITSLFCLTVSFGISTSSGWILLGLCQTVFLQPCNVRSKYFACICYIILCHRKFLITLSCTISSRSHCEGCPNIPWRGTSLIASLTWCFVYPSYFSPSVSPCNRSASNSIHMDDKQIEICLQVYVRWRFLPCLHCHM